MRDFTQSTKENQMLRKILATPVGLPITPQKQPYSAESWKFGAQTKSMACMAGFQLGVAK